MAKRYSQPQIGTPIDRGNPLARGIICCENLAYTANATIVGTKNVPSARGVAKGFGTTLGAGSTDSVQTTLTTSSTARSFLIIYQRAGSGGGGGGRIFDKRTVSGQVEEMQNGGSGMIYGGSWTGGSGLFTWASYPNGTPINCVLSYDKSSTANVPTIYENGIKQAVSVSSAPIGSVITNTDPYVVGNRKNDNARAWDGLIYCFIVWDRALSEDECKSLSDNPWQIFQPTNRAIYPEATAAGSTYTLTADAASYSITGADASLIATRKLIADAVNIPIAGADATLTYTPIGGPTYTLTADAGSIAVNGNAATLAFNRVLTADAGSYSVAGQAVGLAFNRVLSAATANIPVAGQDVTLTYTNNGFTYTLSAEAGAFSVTGQDVGFIWSGEESGESGYTNEVVLKPWYIRRNKKILLFGTAQEADAYIEAEEVAEQAIQEAQKTSRRARKRLRDKLIKVEPIQTVDVDQLTEAVQRFSIPVDLPKLIAQQDYERVMQILALAADMQDEEDIETLLLM